MRTSIKKDIDRMRFARARCQVFDGTCTIISSDSSRTPTILLAYEYESESALITQPTEAVVTTTATTSLSSQLMTTLAPLLPSSLPLRLQTSANDHQRHKFTKRRTNIRANMFVSKESQNVVNRLLLLLPLLSLLLITTLSNNNNQKWGAVYCAPSLLATPDAGGAPIDEQHRQQHQPLRLEHRIACEPISQVNDLELTCQRPLSSVAGAASLAQAAHQSSSGQDDSATTTPPATTIVILEAYYSDLYADRVCHRVAPLERTLSISQLVQLMRRHTSTPTIAPSTLTTLTNVSSVVGDWWWLEPRLTVATTAPSIGVHPITPTTTVVAHQSLAKEAKQPVKQPLCFDDMRVSFARKCSGRTQCHFMRHHDHVWPECVRLKPGHVFVRYLCVDEALFTRYCNTNTAATQAGAGVGVAVANNPAATAAAAAAAANSVPFGFIATPGYPNFYATPEGAQCAWHLDAPVGQQISVTLLDVSLAVSSSFTSEKSHLTEAALTPDNAVDNAGALASTSGADQRAPNELDHGPPLSTDDDEATLLAEDTQSCDSADQLIIVGNNKVNLNRGSSDSSKAMASTSNGVSRALAHVWRRRANVTICQDNWSSHSDVDSDFDGTSNAGPLARFTSDNNWLQVRLVSEQRVALANRGVLLWYDRHGCAAPKRLPSRVRLVSRNHTHEVYTCYADFVFSDTRDTLKVRTCFFDYQSANIFQQSWRPDPLAPCVSTIDDGSELATGAALATTNVSNRSLVVSGTQQARTSNQITNSLRTLQSTTITTSTTTTTTTPMPLDDPFRTEPSEFDFDIVVEQPNNGVGGEHAGAMRVHSLHHAHNSNSNGNNNNNEYRFVDMLVDRRFVVPVIGAIVILVLVNVLLVYVVVAGRRALERRHNKRRHLSSPVYSSVTQTTFHDDYAQLSIGQHGTHSSGHHSPAGNQPM